MTEELKSALRTARDTLLTNPVSPRVEAPADINLHYCRYVAETVVEQVDDADIEILEDGGRGYVHTWIAHAGRHYDAECIDSVADYRHLPFFERHPEAAIHVEPATTDPASLRNRGKAPLYPEICSIESPGGQDWNLTTNGNYAIAWILLGLLLFSIGLGGEWAIHRHLIQQTAALETIFIDTEIIGELIVVVAPIVFFVLLPRQRASSR